MDHGHLYHEDLSAEEWDWRYLAVEKDKPARSDYSILSCAVMTLGLIMFVELVRHRLDHSAKGRPFFTAVLEGVYGERTYSSVAKVRLECITHIHWQCQLSASWSFSSGFC